MPCFVVLKEIVKYPDSAVGFIFRPKIEGSAFHSLSTGQERSKKDQFSFTDTGLKIELKVIV